MLAGVPLQVGFDARAAFLDSRRGLGRVARQLAEALLARDDIELTLFVPRGAEAPEAWRSGPHRVAELRRPRRGAFLWDGPAWAWSLRRRRLDVLHLPAWGVPPLIPVPVVSTLHDVTPLLEPQAVPSAVARRRALQRLATHRRATLVHAISRSTARDAVRALGLPPRRLRVVTHGVDRRTFRPLPRLPLEHVLFVGGADPHKGLGLLLEAWEAPEAASLPPLRVVGPAAADSTICRRAAALPEGRVLLEQPVPDDVLARRYRQAVALILPSRWEGYGLPVLEAFSCGCPAIVTTRGALPEVGADAALYVSASAPASAWTEAVARLAAEPELRDRLAARGLELAAARSWERTAERLVSVYREAAARRSPTEGRARPRQRR